MGSKIWCFQLCFAVCIVIWAIVGMFIGQIRTLKAYGWLANSYVCVPLRISIVTYVYMYPVLFGSTWRK